jgi:type I restriction enzyme, S subunit
MGETHLQEAVPDGAAAVRYQPYPEYKQSGVEWLGNVPEHWEVDRAKWSAISCQNGIWGAEPDGDDDLVCIRVADFDRQSLRVSTEKLTMRSVAGKDRRNRLLEMGNLLLEKSGGGEQQLVGAVVEFNQSFPAVSSNFIARMVASDDMNSRFLVYLHSHLYSGRVNFRSIKQTTGIQNLDSQAYLDEAITYPPLEEQQTIATFLDYKTAKIDALIAKKKALLEKLAEKRISLISHAVTKGLDPSAPMRDSGIDWLGEIPAHWEVKRLKFLSTKIGSGVTPRGGATVYQDSGIPLLRSQNIHFDGLKLQDVAFIDESIHADMKNSQVLNGDVLLNITGASIGRCNFWSGEYEDANVNQHVCIIRPNEKVKTSYLCYAMSSNVGQAQIDIEQTGAGREGLNFEALKTFTFSLPSSEEQQAIVDFLNDKTAKIDGHKEKIESVITRLQEYRSALITNAVTGKIDVRNFRLPETEERVNHG